MSTEAFDLREILGDLPQVLPLSLAMPELIPTRAASSEALNAAKQAVLRHDHPEIQALIWLYVDELDKSHALSQGIHRPLGSLLHAVMHRREGDFSNSAYWLRQAKETSILAAIYGDPYQFTENCQRARGQNPPDLVELQRQEWRALLEAALELKS